MSRIYISGPISGHDLEERRRAFEIVEKRLVNIGNLPFNPMKNGLPHDATTHAHMKRDIEALLKCDIIYMMSGWTHSKGCFVELLVATSVGLTVIFEESGDITKFK